MALRGVLSYVKVSNPRSISPRDHEAKALAILIAEVALEPKKPDAIDVEEVPNTALPNPLYHPVNPKMGEVVP